MIIPGLIIFHNPLLNAFLSHIQRQMYLTVLRTLRRHHSQLHRIQGMTCITARDIRQKAVELGMQTLAGDGWEKITQGITTVEEVTRVTFDTLTSLNPEP